MNVKDVLIKCIVVLFILLFFKMINLFIGGTELLEESLPESFYFFLLIYKVLVSAVTFYLLATLTLILSVIARTKDELIGIENKIIIIIISIFVIYFGFDVIYEYYNDLL